MVLTGLRSPGHLTSDISTSTLAQASYSQAAPVLVPCLRLERVHGVSRLVCADLPALKTRVLRGYCQ
eukprot:1162103-Pelagomonas_calceolata.AAC.4